MIYVFDNLTTREKVLFLNNLKDINNFPPIYINYLNPIRELIETSPYSFGATVMGGDDFLAFNNEIDSHYLSESPFKKNMDKVNTIKTIFKDEFYSIIQKKLKRFLRDHVIIDGLYDKEAIDTLFNDNKTNIVVIKSKKTESLIENDNSYGEFVIDIEKYTNNNNFKKDLQKFVEDNTKEIVFEIPEIILPQAA